MAEITIPKLEKLLRARALKPYTCVAMAQRALQAGRSIDDVFAILRVDADKIRPINRSLYELIQASNAKRLSTASTHCEQRPNTQSPIRS